MRQKDDRFTAVTNAFTSAAFGGEGWHTALAGMARLCGFRVGELIGFGSTAIEFNFMSDFDPAATVEFAEIGGGRPDVNARVRAAAYATVMKSLTEADFLSPDEFRTDPFYTDYCRRHEISFGCVMPMIRDQGNMVGLAMFRDMRRGNATSGERALFERLAPHIRDAVRMRATLEEQGALILKGAFDVMSLGVFVCNRYGTVRALSRFAEDVLAANRGLRLRQGQLRAAHATEDQILSGAIQLATTTLPVAAESGGLSTAVVHDQNLEPLVLDVVPLPRGQNSLGFEPRALVVIRAQQRDERRTLALLQIVHRLTPAEAQVALQLVDGQSAEEIAASRNVAISTVRVQIRSLFGKLGARRQSEVATKVRQLL